MDFDDFDFWTDCDLAAPNRVPRKPIKPGRVLILVAIAVGIICGLVVAVGR